MKTFVLALHVIGFFLSFLVITSKPNRIKKEFHL